MSKGQQHLNDLVTALNKDCSYNLPNKNKFHAVATRFLKEVKKDIGATEGKVRSNKGGIAVSGEVTLHTNSLYLQFGQYFGGNDVCLYRICNGLNDFTGGRNNFISLSELSNMSYESFLRKVDI